MSAELHSMLRFQEQRMASGELNADELAAIARSYLQLERESKAAAVTRMDRHPAGKVRLVVLSGGAS